MALMPGLQINVGQHLKLTPQLQQSIKILQYSALEVQQTITTTLETNFMLELEEDIDELDVPEYAEEPLNETDNDSNAVEHEIDLENANTLSDDMNMDCQWDEVYFDTAADTPISTATSSNNSDDDYTAAENYTAAHQSLADALNWQSNIYPWHEFEAVIAAYLIDEIDEEGFLKTPLEEILNAIQQNEELLNGELELADIEAVLHVIQQFDPTGVGARSLQETLLLQLKAIEKKTPYVVTAKALIEENFELLSTHDFKRIRKIYGLNEDELTRVVQIIQSLSPRPGCVFANSEDELIIPDLRLHRAKNGFVVELNPNAFPRLSVNQAYVDLAAKLPSNSDQGKQIKEQLFEAKGLIKSIHSRGETLLRVGKYIVEKQARFFEEGEQAMSPMVLRDVAESLELHESTISRATNQKYIQTPRGTYELKYFFSTGVSQYGSDDQSAIAIKSHIKQLLDGENPKKPLSDNKLMDLLEEKDIIVARRTIAKYREAMGIPSSSERKKLNQFK